MSVLFYMIIYIKFSGYLQEQIAEAAAALLVQPEALPAGVS